jgi:hypothetical protein
LAAPLNEGDPITTGPLLRYIPNWDKIMWEYDRDRPSPRAWRERPDEDYVSIFREAEDAEGGTSAAKLHDLKPKFALYRVTAETLISLGSVRIEYRPIPNIPEGHAHCGIFGINRSRAERLARNLTERVHGPGPAEPPPSAGGDEAPRDLWQMR